MTRRMRTVLVLSVFINVFTIGAIGGGIYMLHQPGGLRILGGVVERPIRTAGETLSPEERGQFRRDMRRTLFENRRLLRIARESRTEAAGLFVQPQFDQAAVLGALERARNADVELRTRLEAVAVAFAATLPQNERERLAEGLERGGPLRHPGPPASPAPQK